MINFSIKNGETPFGRWSTLRNKKMVKLGVSNRTKKWWPVGLPGNCPKGVFFWLGTSPKTWGKWKLHLTDTFLWLLWQGVMKPSPFFWGMEFDANLWQIKFELVMLVDGSGISCINSIMNPVMMEKTWGMPFSSDHWDVIGFWFDFHPGFRA